MTRKEIEATYKVVNNRIVSPGKFEGETVYAPYFYSMSLDGCTEQLDTPDGLVCLVEIDAADRAEWGALIPAHCAYAMVHESDIGFVYVSLLSARKADAVRAAAENEGEQ